MNKKPEKVILAEKLKSSEMKPLSFRKQLTLKNTVLGVQFLFVAFGATVLVPLLVGIDPAVALFTAGIGTLLFHFITKRQVPVFLGSSFAFIAPIIEATRLLAGRARYPELLPLVWFMVLFRLW